MAEGIGTSLLCSLCDSVCKRGAQMKCCGTRACRACALLKINKIKICWECGQEDVSLANDKLLRKAVEHFLNNGKVDPAHEKMLKKTGKNSKTIIANNVDVVEKFNQPCWYGEECKNKGCLFVHSKPTLADKKSVKKGNGKPCNKGQNCTNSKCEFGHPLAPKSATVKGTNPGANGKPCKFGALCTKKDTCKFEHFKTNKPCKFGAGCSSKSCKFDHSPSNKALDRAISNFKRGIKPMGGDLRFILANKRQISGGMWRIASMKMRMRQIERDEAERRNTNLEQMLKMKEELDSMMASVGSRRTGSGGMGGGFGRCFMGMSRDRMDGRIWNRGYGGSSTEKMDCDMYCIMCQTYGHIPSKECVVRAVCFNCGSKGHVRRNCNERKRQIKNIKKEEIKRECIKIEEIKQENIKIEKIKQENVEME